MKFFLSWFKLMTLNFKATYRTKEDAMKAVVLNGMNLSRCTPKLQDDEDVVMAAIKTYDWVFQYASDELKSNKTFIMKAIHEGVYPWYLIQYSNIDIKSDIEVISLALEKSQSSLVFGYAQGEASLNKELAAKALIKWCDCYGSTNFELWDKLCPTLKEFFPSNSFYEKAQAYLIQLEQEQQAEVVSGGSTTEDSVVW